MGKPRAYIKTATVFQFLSKPRAYTGQTYNRTYFTPPKEQSSEKLISDPYCHDRSDNLFIIPRCAGPRIWKGLLLAATLYMTNTIPLCFTTLLPSPLTNQTGFPPLKNLLTPMFCLFILISKNKSNLQAINANYDSTYQFLKQVMFKIICITFNLKVHTLLKKHLFSKQCPTFRQSPILSSVTKKLF